MAALWHNSNTTYKSLQSSFCALNETTIHQFV